MSVADGHPTDSMFDNFTTKGTQLMYIYPISYKSKYERWYYNIIKNAKCQIRFRGDGCYYESHHIIPRSLGGNNTKENLVLLTGREHFICHWLLYNTHKGQNKLKMAHAWFMMCNTKKNQRYTPNSKIYEAAKKAHSIAIGKILSGIPRNDDIKNKISQSNRGIAKTQEHRKNLSAALKGRKLSETHIVNRSKARIGIPRKESTKMKISQTKTGIKHSDEHTMKNSKAKKGENNPQFAGYFITPWGKFSSSVDAANSAPYKCSPPLIRRWCKDNNKKVFVRPKFLEWAGKTPAQIGFGFYSICN
jgi:hypothetical protein